MRGSTTAMFWMPSSMAWYTFHPLITCVRVTTPPQSTHTHTRPADGQHCASTLTPHQALVGVVCGAWLADWLY
jgi:hypothetical protein